MNPVNPVAQEHPLGCSVACVAALCKITYQEAIKFFDVPDHAWIRGYYCSEIVKALKNAGLTYAFQEISDEKSDALDIPGTIVFVAPGSVYPSGHFFLRVENGWMNPWCNFPQMIPVQAAIEQALPGPIAYAVFQLSN